MRKSKFSEHQIIVIDPESLEAGRNVKDVCREHEISDAQLTTSGSRCTLAWQASDIKRLRELEEETRRLKQISGWFAGESGAERCDAKKALNPAAKRELVAVLQTEHG